MVEVSNVIPPVPEVIQFDEPKRIDYLDRYKHAANFYPLDISVTAMALGASLLDRDLATMIIAGAMPVAIGSGTALLVENARATRYDSKNNIADKQLGYSADRIVYKGRSGITIDDKRFKKGDNFYYLSLPTLEKGSNPQLLVDLYDASIKDFRDRIGSKDYKFVAINLANIEEGIINSFSKEFPTAARKKLFEGKFSKTKGEDERIMLLTREQFEALTISPQELFDKASESLGDPLFLTLVNIGKGVSTEKQRAEIRTRMLGRLEAILTWEVENKFNSVPDVVVERGPNYEPVKKRYYSTSQIKKSGDTFFFVQVNTANGEMKWVPLDRLLKTADKPIDAILSVPSTLRKAQLAYVLTQMIEGSQIEDLLRRRDLSRDEVIAALGRSKTALKAGRDLFSHVRIRDRYIPQGLLGKARPIVGSLILSAAIGNGLNIASEEGLFNFGNQDGLPTSIELGSPGVPKAGIDWEISGNIPTNGYYVTGTSREFQNGTWDVYDQGGREISLPTDIGHDSKYIGLGKTIQIDQLNETRLKVPIRENSTLSAINLIGPDGKSVPFQTIQYDDGSVEIRIPPAAAAYADVDVSLIPSIGNEIHSTNPIGGIDTTQLSDKARQIVQNADTQGAEGIDYIDSEVQTDHKYSVDQTNNDALQKTNNPIEAANLIAALDTCSCEVCNTESVILANALQNPSDTLNLAFGYLSFPNNQNPGATDGGFLRSETSHAFGIGSDGQIYDATAQVIAADEATREYINLLRNPPLGIDNWLIQHGEIINNAQQMKNFIDELKLLAIASAAAIALYGIKSGGEKLSNKAAGVDVMKVSDEIISRGFSPKDLGKGLNFFMWLSYGKTEHRVAEIPTDEPKPSIIGGIRDNVSYDKLLFYLQNPKKLERIANERGFHLSPVEKIKMRALANYILSTG